MGGKKGTEWEREMEEMRGLPFLGGRRVSILSRWRLLPCSRNIGGIQLLGNLPCSRNIDYKGR